MALDAFMGCSDGADDVDLKLRSVTIGTVQDVIVRGFFDRGRAFSHGDLRVKC